MTDLDQLRVDWLAGDNQDVISVMDTRQADAWPLLELSPADAMTFAMRVMERARQALHAYYPDGRAVADGRIPVPAGGAGEAQDFLPEEEPVPYVPAQDIDPEPLPRRVARCSSTMPYIGRWSR